MKRTYDTPVLEVVGSLVDTTGGNKAPVTSLDATFPAKTPFRKLTWS
jgi:hypothetical protein